MVGSVATLPIFRPLIGMDKEEITAEAIEARQLSDFDHARPGLLHAVHAAQSADPGAAGARSRRRSRRCRSTRLSSAPFGEAVVEDFEFPVRRIDEARRARLKRSRL